MDVLDQLAHRGDPQVRRQVEAQSVLGFQPGQQLQAGGANAAHRGDPAHDTADFADVPGPGNLSADYVLPSYGLQVRGGGVFWPPSSDPLSRLTGTFPFPRYRATPPIIVCQLSR